MYFMMCFPEYLENQNFKQMYLFVGEMSNYAASSWRLHAQFQVLAFWFSCKHSSGKTVMPPGWDGFLCSDLGWAVPKPDAFGQNPNDSQLELRPFFSEGGRQGVGGSCFK